MIVRQINDKLIHEHKTIQTNNEIEKERQNDK